MKTRQSIPWDIEEVKEYLLEQDKTGRNFFKVSKDRVIKKAKQKGVSKQYGGVELTFYLGKVYITALDFDMVRELGESND